MLDDPKFLVLFGSVPEEGWHRDLGAVGARLGIPNPFSLGNGNAEGRDGCLGGNKTSPKFWIGISRDSSLQDFRRSSKLSECGNAVRQILSSVLFSNLVLIFGGPFNP